MSATPKDQDDQYGAEEAARRRDRVIREMVNTPPQPNGKSNPHRPEKKKPTAARRMARKSDVGGKVL